MLILWCSVGKKSISEVFLWRKSPFFFFFGLFLVCFPTPLLKKKNKDSEDSSEKGKTRIKLRFITI